MVWPIQKAYVMMKRESDPKLWSFGFFAGWLASLIVIGLPLLIFFTW